MRWVLPAVLVSLLIPSHPAAACPASSPITRPLSTQGDAIADGGGVLLETTYGFGRNNDDASSSLALRAGSRRIRDAISIAGTLSLLPAPRGGGAVQLVDGRGKVVRSFKRANKPRALAAPKLEGIRMTVPAGGPGPRNIRDPYSRPIVTTTVALAEAPPAGAVAIVFYAGKDPEARGWYAVSAGVTSFATRTGGKQCRGPSGGALYTQVGEKLTAAWVDQYGRVNGRSPAVEVTAVTTP